MLEVKNITAGYNGTPIVRDVSFKVSAGEIACVLGQNGCGKTTLLKACTKIIPAMSGSVYIADDNILQKKRKDIAKLITLMGGRQQSYFSYTVFQTVLLARYAQSDKKLLAETFSKADCEKTDTVLRQCNIAHLRERFLTELSSGQLQKVFFAQAIAQETPVIFLDEPTSHLDLKAQIDLAEILSRLTREKKLSVLAVFHDINFALQFADRIILMKDGAVFSNTKKSDVDFEKLNTLYDTDVKGFMRKSLAFWK